MTGRAQEFVALRDTAPFRLPGAGDVLGRIVATDREQARQVAARIYPNVAVVVVRASAWPLTDDAGGKTLHSTAVEKRGSR